MSSEKDVLSDILGNTEEEEMISIDEILQRARTAAPENNMVPLEDILGSAYEEASAAETRFEDAGSDAVFPDSVEKSVHESEEYRPTRSRRSTGTAAPQRTKKVVRKGASPSPVTAAPEKKAAAPSPRSAERRRRAEDSERAYEQAVARADYFMTIAALLLTLFFYLTQYLMTGTANYALCATVLGSLAVEKGVMGVKTDSRRDRIFAVVYGIVTLLATVMHFVAMKR